MNIVHSTFHSVHCTQVLDLAWVKVHVWEEAETMEVPREGVIRGMQVMYSILLSCTPLLGCSEFGLTSIYFNLIFYNVPHSHFQANMFKLVLDSRLGQSKTVMVKRVVPRYYTVSSGTVLCFYVLNSISRYCTAFQGTLLCF